MIKNIIFLYLFLLLLNDHILAQKKNKEKCINKIKVEKFFLYRNCIQNECACFNKFNFYVILKDKKNSNYKFDSIEYKVEEVKRSNDVLFLYSKHKIDKVYFKDSSFINPSNDTLILEANYIHKWFHLSSGDGAVPKSPCSERNIEPKNYIMGKYKGKFIATSRIIYYYKGKKIKQNIFIQPSIQNK